LKYKRYLQDIVTLQIKSTCILNEQLLRSLFMDYQSPYHLRRISQYGSRVFRIISRNRLFTHLHGSLPVFHRQNPSPRQFTHLFDIGYGNRLLRTFIPRQEYLRQFIEKQPNTSTSFSRNTNLHAHRVFHILLSRIKRTHVRNKE